MAKGKKNKGKQVFHTLAEINNTSFSGDKDSDLKILDGIMDYIYTKATSMKDKVEAAKRLATYFGDDPESITGDYVERMMKEYASVRSVYYLHDRGKAMEKANKKKSTEQAASGNEQQGKAQTKRGVQWFGEKDHTHQTFDSKVLDEVTKKIRSKLANQADKAFKINLEFALAILKSIEKRSKFKTKVTSKEKQPNGAVVMTFTVSGFIMLSDYVSSQLKITANPNKSFTLTVGG